MGRYVLLWLLGVPIPILLLIWLIGGLHWRRSWRGSGGGAAKERCSGYL